MPINEIAATGFQSAAAEYERSRPGYPDAAVARIVEICELGGSSRLLDLACGTGKMTRQIASVSDAAIVGADPVEGMLAQFAAVLPAIPAVAGVAEALPFADASFDACVVAQGFHWFDGDRALAELHRILRPRSALVAIWNTRDESVPWVRAMNEIFDRYEGDVARFWKGKWPPAFASTTDFSPLQREDFLYEQRLTRGGVVERVLSVSFIAALPPAERDLVAEQVVEILDRDPETSLVSGDDEIVLPYRTELYWCRRKS